MKLHYHFGLNIYGQTLQEGFWLELENRQAALEKARQIARSLLDFGDRTVSWTDAMLVVVSSDGRDIIHVPIVDLVADEGRALRH